MIGIAALGAAYFMRARRGPSAADRFPVTVGDASRADSAQLDAAAASQGPSAGQRASFVLSMLLLFFTLNGPLHDLSDYYLFSAHMVQHLILTLIVPPLMILGTPGWMLRPLLRNKTVYAIARKFTSFGACFAIFNIVLAFWHLPPMYNLALAQHPVHIFQHLMFISASVFMWWPLTSQLPELDRKSVV